MWKKTTSALREKGFGDVHTRLMKKNYEQVPEWWFVSILALMVVVALITCEGFGKQLQLPWWGVLLSLVIALVFTLPIGVIQATTNMVKSIVTEQTFLQFPIASKFCLFSPQSVTCFAASRAQRDYRVNNRVPLPREATCQCSLQDLRLHQHVTGTRIPWRLQTRPLHENSSKIHVHSAGRRGLDGAWFQNIHKTYLT